ncbi:MAG: hypothetical protein Q8P29_00590, partial [Candidatus Levybacteria bacterium]|nr:hypothetical protein [Candidatus Levybacteria bacterium]
MHIHTLRKITKNFVHEIKLANSGKKTSLAFIVHELSPSPIVKDGEVFMSIVIGGTVGKIATLKKNGNAIQIIGNEEEQLSFKDGKEFLYFINKKLPENIDTLALNFAYPIKPIFADGKLDGILLSVTKEGGFHGLVGKQVGQEIENYV